MPEILFSKLGMKLRMTNLLKHNAYVSQPARTRIIKKNEYG